DPARRPAPHVPLFPSRRDFLLQAGGGFGALALASLLQRDGLLQASEPARPMVPANPMAPRLPHFAGRARAVIFLFMEGGPSHLAPFDPKPELTRLQGQRLPASFGPVFTPMGVSQNALMASRRRFRKYGRSGLEVSDWLPHMATCADDLA